MMNSAEESRRSIWQMIKPGSGTAVDQRNGMVFSAWCLAWAVCYVVASKLLKGDFDLSTTMTWTLVAVPNFLSIVAVGAYMRFLRMADELLRKIQLQGLAMGFGAGVVLITGYQLFEAAGARELQTDHIVVVMMFSWVAGQLLGTWRYR